MRRGRNMFAFARRSFKESPWRAAIINAVTIARPSAGKGETFSAEWCNPQRLLDRAPRSTNEIPVYEIVLGSRGRSR